MHIEVSQQEMIILIDEIVRFIKLQAYDPYARLTECCLPLIERSSAKYFLRGYSRDDFRQEGLMVLIQALNEYDFERGMPFMQYFHLRLSNHYRRLLRRELAQKRTMTTQAVSLEEATENYGDSVFQKNIKMNDIDEEIIVREQYEHYLNDLSPMERDVYAYYLEGHSREEIAEMMSCRTGQVVNALYRCSAKMRHFFDS